LHLVGDHLYVSRSEKGCAQQLVEVAEAEACAISAVQATRESLLPYYGTIGGRRVPGRPNLYQIETVIEKPTPTEAEQQLIVPGLRAGHYLCFFGMHVLTPTVIDILGQQIEAAGEQVGLTLSAALAELARREQYLALEKQDFRYDVGVKYGLLTAQLALALNGQDRDEVLSKLLELLALRELGR
jgi:UTP--glucose-1-phosphate uridylyltransferase